MLFPKGHAVEEANRRTANEAFKAYDQALFAVKTALHNLIASTTSSTKNPGLRIGREASGDTIE